MSRARNLTTRATLIGHRGRAALLRFLPVEVREMLWIEIRRIFQSLDSVESYKVALQYHHYRTNLIGLPIDVA